MSKISLTPNASGTGTFTIASPDSNTNRTLTLPDVDGPLLAGSQAAFIPATVSGATQALDVGAANFFDAGALTADTTVSFTNVPTEARWTYIADSERATVFDLEVAFYDSKSAYVAADPQPYDVFFKPDGTKMYIVGITGDSVYQHTLSTPWDVDTAVYDSVSFSVGAQDTSPFSLFFKPDGTKMYISGIVNDRIYQYTLSTPWDISTASYDSVIFSVAAQDTSPAAVFFKSDGTKMYITGQTNDTIYQYSLSTAWAVNTASYDSISFNVNSQATIPQGLAFNSDGTKMFVVDVVYNFVHEYNLSTAWSLNTASYSSKSFFVGNESTASRGIFVKPDETKMYVVGVTERKVSQYTIASPFAVTLPASVQNLPLEKVLYDDKIAYTFVTTDGGTTVKLINEEVL